MENDLSPDIVLGATARHIFGILFVDADLKLLPDNVPAIA